MFKVDLKELIKFVGNLWINFMVFVSRNGRFLIIILCIVVFNVVKSLFLVKILFFESKFIKVDFFILVYFIKVICIICLWFLC